MAEAGYQFETISPMDKEEPIQLGELPSQYVQRIAKDKLDSVIAEFGKKIKWGKNDIVLACDTVVCANNEILGKPLDREDARRMLSILSGTEHDVFSGIVLFRPLDHFMLSASEVTRLRMLALSADTIEEYIDSGLWEGKAGGFGWQDRTGWLEIVDGSPSNIVGLPLERLALMMEEISKR